MTMPEVGKDEQDEAVKERDAGIARVRPEERGADRLGQAEADGAADQRAEEVGDLRLAQPRLDADDDRPSSARRPRALIQTSAVNGRTRTAAYVTARTNSTRTIRCQGMNDLRYECRIYEPRVDLGHRGPPGPVRPHQSSGALTSR